MTITLEIIDYAPRKGRNKKHEVAKPNPVNKDDLENYYIELACIVREDGKEVKDKTLTITSNRDATQNKTISVTGVVRKIYDGDTRRIVPVYPYHYDFKQPGNHKITFTCEGISQEVDIVVQP